MYDIYLAIYNDNLELKISKYFKYNVCIV